MVFGRIKALYFKARNHFKTGKETAFYKNCRKSKTLDLKDIQFLQVKSYSGSFQIGLSAFLLFFTFSEVCVLNLC